MKSDKASLESKLANLRNTKLKYENEWYDLCSSEYTTEKAIGNILKANISIDEEHPELDQLKTLLASYKSKIRILEGKLEKMPKKIREKAEELKKAKDRLDNFDAQLSQTVNQYDSSQLGKITGTAGLMVLANLGGFATYTFLTSMMSTLSFGTLGFGTYTAATSFLSVVIGPVGWAGLGLWAIITLGKPDMNKMILLVATLSAIRQRTLYEVSPV